MLKSGYNGDMKMENENKRKIKRLISIIIVAAIILTGSVYFATRKEPPQKVRVSELSYGDISSRMYVKAQVHPGDIVSHNAPVRQKVTEISVKPGDRVEKGDILFKLDQSELQTMYLDAKKAREEIEESIRSQDIEQSQREQNIREQEILLNKSLSEVNDSLSSLLGNISLLGSISPSESSVSPDLNGILEEYLAGFDPESDNLEDLLKDISREITQSVTVTENPQYRELLENIQLDIQSLSTSLPNLISSLTSNLTSGLASSISIPPQLLTQFGMLGINISDPLTQARQTEERYKSMYEDSLPFVTAEISGLVAKVNLTEGSYTGPSQSNSTSGIENILSEIIGQQTFGLIPGSSQVTEAAVTIYDNLNPKAVFKVSQFDSSRLTEGLDVEYLLSGNSYSGKVIYKSAFVPGTGFGQSDTNDFLSGIGMVTGTGSEPQLDIEMSIEGENLAGITLGFLIDAQIRTATASNVLILPAEAMKRELGEYYVFVVDEENNVRRTTFTPGIQSDMFVEIKSGLYEGQKVVLNPPNSLTDGNKVEITGG